MFYIWDDRFGPTYFDTEAARDAAFWNARYIDQKHWWVGDAYEKVLRAAPRSDPSKYLGDVPCV